MSGTHAHFCMHTYIHVPITASTVCKKKSLFSHSFYFNLVTHLFNRYNKTAAQVMIRWSVQRGFITIPKSVHEDRIIENAQVFDWSIEEEDFNAMVNSHIPYLDCTWGGNRRKCNAKSLI